MTHGILVYAQHVPGNHLFFQCLLTHEKWFLIIFVAEEPRIAEKTKFHLYGLHIKQQSVFLGVKYKFAS